jgi:hypothetical protein
MKNLSLFLEEKNETFRKFLLFKHELENQIVESIQILWLDRRGEYTCQMNL